MDAAVARDGVELVHDVAINLKNLFRRKFDCYNGRHNMRAEKVWNTANWSFLQEKCERCGVRKVTRTQLGD